MCHYGKLCNFNEICFHSYMYMILLYKCLTQKYHNILFTHEKLIAIIYCRHSLVMELEIQANALFSLFYSHSNILVKNCLKINN